MPTNRLEAFSDGVMAVIITIMVLELHVPSGDDFAALLREVGPGLLTYLLSFIYIGIYWNNHHHLFQLVETTSGAALWANLHLLFWLSLLPLTTGWMDDSGLARVPVAVYGADLVAAAIAWMILQRVIMRSQGELSELHAAVGRDAKGRISPVLYLIAIVSALVVMPVWEPAVWISIACYVAVAAMWVIPDRRIERYLAQRDRAGEA